MAIYRLHAQVIKRSDGRSVVAAAAYRCGQRYEDARTGEVHDYSRRHGVDSTHQLVPEGAGAWLSDIAQCWRSVEQGEKRSDAQLAREVQLALPIELTPQQRETLAVDFVRREFVSLGMVATVALHDQAGGNPHAHILLSLRGVEGSGWGAKRREWNDRRLLERWREQWQHAANRALRAAGFEARIDCRTLEAQLADAEAEAVRCEQWQTAEMERQHRQAVVDRRRELAEARTIAQETAEQIQAERTRANAVGVSVENAERVADQWAEAAERSQHRAAQWAKAHPVRVRLYRWGWGRVGRYYAQQVKQSAEREAKTKKAKHEAERVRANAEAEAAATAEHIAQLETQRLAAEQTVRRLTPKPKPQPTPAPTPTPDPTAEVASECELEPTPHP